MRAVGGGDVGVCSDAHGAAECGAVVIALGDGRRALQHAHAGLHVDTRMHSGSARARHAADGGGHLVHVVVREMAVEHPVAGIVGDEFDVACLRNADEHGVARPPRRLRDAAAFGAGDVEGVAVQVHRVMVHAEVHEPDAHTAAERHDHGRDGGAGLAVEDEPVVLHAHGVRDGARGEDGVLLQVDEEVVIDGGLIGRGGMHDEAAEHADHLLHGHV